MQTDVPYQISEETEKLEQRLKEGEHLHQDFKQTITDYHKIARSVVAFANQKGGRLFIGVGDRGEITGCSPRAEYYRLVDLLESYCDPIPEAACYVYDLKGREVLEAVIREGSPKPYAALDRKGNWIIYLRSGDTCRKVGKR